MWCKPGAIPKTLEKSAAMSTYNHTTSAFYRARSAVGAEFSLARNMTGEGVNFRFLSLVMLLVVSGNFVSQYFFKENVFSILDKMAAPTPALYLIEEASANIPESEAFEAKVREVSTELEVAPEWLMAVMFSESRLNPAAVNLRGSGATGLIQFMPMVAEELGTTCDQIRAMSAVEQMNLVHRYLQRIRTRYGDYQNLTDLYLAILYPRAITGDENAVLYVSPSIAYKQNAGLDENKDGRVTARDIDRRMRRLFPTAYMALRNA